MASIYIETSIVSYLRERQASHVVAAARQILTKRWWSDERKKYTLVTSQYVIDEASLGDSVLAQERLLYLDDLPLLAVDPEIVVLADALMSSAALPRKAESDALHIAIAACMGRIPADMGTVRIWQMPGHCRSFKRSFGIGCVLHR